MAKKRKQEPEPKGDDNNSTSSDVIDDTINNNNEAFLLESFDLMADTCNCCSYNQPGRRVASMPWVGQPAMLDEIHTESTSKNTPELVTHLECSIWEGYSIGSLTCLISFVLGLTQAIYR